MKRGAKSEVSLHPQPRKHQKTTTELNIILVVYIITDLLASAHIFTKWKVLFYRTGELEDEKEEDF